MNEAFALYTPQERKEYLNFRSWLFRIRKEELIHAMEIEFETSSEGSHEFDLLQEMVKLQIPMETPVHPKALGYKNRSKDGPTLDYEHSKEKSRWTRPRMFQWSPKNSLNRTKGRSQQRFDVLARNKLAPWGDVYSLGTTREQREMDMHLIKGTYIKSSNSTSRRAIYKADQQSVRDIIHMLHLASRGHFLRPQKRPSISFCSSWLQPTERWFSLSFYLASRFQVAIWATFRKNGKANASPHYPPGILKTVITSAMHMGIKEALQNDTKSLDFLRDSITWRYVNTSGLGYCGGDWNTVYNALTHVPLLEMQNPAQHLYALVRKSLEVTLALELEKALLDEPAERRVQSDRKSKKQKRNKKRKGRRRNAVQKKNPLQIKDDEDVGIVRMVETVPNMLRFPDNQTPPRERNRNMIMVLSLLDDCVESVFLKVGLEPSVPFAQSDDCQKNKSAKLKQPYFRACGDNHRRDQSEEAKNREPLPNLASASQNEVVSFESAVATDRIPSPLSFQWPSANPVDYYPLQGSGAIQSPFSETLLSSDLYSKTDTLEEFSFGQQSNPINEWPFVNRYQNRERSILTDFFLSQEDRSDDDEKLMTASTAASISSSTYKDFTAVADAEDMDKGSPEESGVASEMVTITEDDASMKRNMCMDDMESKDGDAMKERKTSEAIPRDSVPEVTDRASMASEDGKEIEEAQRDEESSTSTKCRSPSPEAPNTPPPTLSPILVSLADLQHLKHLALTPERSSSASGMKKTSLSLYDTPMPGSLPSSPVLEKDGLMQSWSREDLRIDNFRDDHRIRQRKGIQARTHRLVDLQQSYKAVAVKSLAKPIASSRSGNIDFRTHLLESTGKKEQQRESCAQSETAMDGRSEDLQWQQDSRKHLFEEIESKVVIKDETTTITSALSHREVEDFRSIREERNSFRDMCLTLGAEVAKLKAMLAAQTATSSVPYPEGFNQPMYSPGSFDPHSMPPFFHGMRGQRNGAMSDAGIHRVGDHESQVSEDDGFDAISRSRLDATRQMSSTATVAESDTSIEIAASVIQGGLTGRISEFEASPVHGLQSRLTKDIMRFLNSTKSQLQKQESKRRLSFERFSRLVDNLWPRAQVKLYGSHVSGLCLPSSDLDFVVCLPAVHKNAPALAPGVLEGRNAINESCQKLLARELKGESWIDPRSIKLIERTVVPVIKVSTKDTRARVLQLDISFDSPEHHGLAAVEMVSQILEELPLIRPLVLVIKQFLLDRGLLTAYTGGLSSYCLFLMVARYLQEQPSSYGDCGSLLMGFLDFYGNFFDPRATGISVRRRQYFVRPNYTAASYHATGDGMWPPPSPTHQTHAASTSPAKTPRDFLRRNSFNDAGSVDDIRRPARPHRLPTGHRYASHNIAHTDKLNSNFEHGRPFTFDPLFVEDPLSSRNNVGRNAFRIFQVQRAFSDAHRALVASLEWDINLSGELNDDVDYPLLKCLLHSEDVLYEL